MWESGYSAFRWKSLESLFIHLLISLAIFIVLLAIICLWWYPGALFEIAGGWQGCASLPLSTWFWGHC